MRITLLLIAVTLLVPACVIAQPTPKERPMHLYLGTYTGQKQPPQSLGIYHAVLDPATGTLSGPSLVAETKNPSFLAIHPTMPVLYAIGEMGEFQGKPAGMVSAFAIDRATAKLAPLGEPRSSTGPGPSYVSVTPDGRAVLVANYGGGSVGSLPVGDDGSLGEPVSHHQHTGSGPNPKRQKEPHAHSIVPAPGASRYALSADLGTDEVRVYEINGATAALTPATPPAVQTDPGGGPRHTAFSPDAQHAYVNNEMGNTVTAYAWTNGPPFLTKIQSVPTLPPDYAGPENTTAEVAVHPTGKFVYVSNRGHDSIAVFQRDPATGKLKAAGQTKSGGVQPRHFAVSPDGKYLLAAHQKTHNVVVFTIDATTGALSPNGSEIQLAAPVCVRFVRDGIVP